MQRQHVIHTEDAVKFTAGKFRIKDGLKRILKQSVVDRVSDQIVGRGDCPLFESAVLAESVSRNRLIHGAAERIAVVPQPAFRLCDGWIAVHDRLPRAATCGGPLTAIRSLLVIAPGGRGGGAGPRVIQRMPERTTPACTGIRLAFGAVQIVIEPVRSDAVQTTTEADAGGSGLSP